MIEKKEAIGISVVTSLVTVFLTLGGLLVSFGDRLYAPLTVKTNTEIIQKQQEIYGAKIDDLGKELQKIKIELVSIKVLIDGRNEDENGY